MKIRRLGHAALLIEADGTRILVDPGTYSSDDAFALTDLDGIVVTHQHGDHADPARLPSLLEANPDAVVLAEEGAIETVPALAGRATPLRAGDTVRVGAATVTGLGGRHAVIHPDLGRVGNVGATIEAGGRTLFHPGDAYEFVADGVDVLALPMSAPWAKLAETVEFVRAVKPGIVIPIHDAGLSPTGSPMYRRNVENLGRAGRYEWLDPDGTLELD